MSGILRVSALPALLWVAAPAPLYIWAAVWLVLNAG